MRKARNNRGCREYMNCSLNCWEAGFHRIFEATILGLIKGDARSLEHGSYRYYDAGQRAQGLGVSAHGYGSTTRV